MLISTVNEGSGSVPSKSRSGQYTDALLAAAHGGVVAKDASCLVGCVKASFDVIIPVFIL